MNVEVSQAEFARRMGVSRAAVSQWKSSGILGDDAFTKPGKKGKLHFAIAAEHVRKNRDLGQSLGNGLGTKVPSAPPPQPHPQPEPVQTPAAPPAASSDPEPGPAQDLQEAMPLRSPEADVKDKIAAARLEAQLRTNRMEAAKEAFQADTLMSSDDAREQMGRIAGTLLQIFEGALPDFAADLAEHFGIPQRDALHVLRAQYIKVRATAAQKEAQRLARLNAGTSIEVDT